MVVSAVIAALLVFLVLFLLKGKVGLASLGGPTSRFPFIEKLVGLATGLFFLLLVITGFWYLAAGQPRMTGNALMAHVGGGSVFAGVILVFGILRAHVARFGAETGFHPAYKFAFWGFLLSALALILTAVVPMLPWLGTHGQEATVGYHRYAAAASVFFGLLMCLLRMVRK